ncbi:MAG: hypothetical protein C4542_09770 [Dehalococcoidia bacterium]|nr:MAG: hypothetical protein C4542_09770 [Dehalococcoidia bacterium]
MDKERQDEPELGVLGHWRTARKAHLCRQCLTWITPGDRYYEDLSATPAYQTGEAYCKPCAQRLERKATGG